MSIITDLNDIIDQNLPDNNLKLITEAKMRETLKGIVAKFSDLLEVYLRVNLNQASSYTHSSLQVATNRLMIVREGTIMSNGPVNDDPDPDPNNWPYPGGATPTSWAHDPATGKVTFPLPTDTIEIFIRPVL